MNAEFAALLARHALTALGAVFATKLDIDQPTLETVIGSLATVVGVSWSIIDKKTRKS